MRRGLLSILLALLLTVGKSQVVGFEYFIDSDPGVGNGIPLELEPGSSIGGFYNIPLNKFEQGFHRIGLRSHDIQGAYSQTLIHSFFITPSSSSQLVEVEYYIDSDPGQGNGLKIPIQMDAEGGIRYIIPLSEVNVGGHLLGIRTKDNLGFWSQTQLHFFYNQGDGELANIVRFEYYFTGDGAGDTVFSHIVEEPSPYVELDFVANVSELVPDREYEMHIYAISDDGRRSFVVINRVNICSDEPPSANFSYAINNELVDLTNLSNNYSEIKWLLEDEVFSTGETASFAYGDPGIFEVGLIASNYCTADTLYQYITVPGIEKIYPTVGTIQQKEATITITGFGFDSIPSLRLYDESGKTILPTQVIKADSLNLRAVFNLSEVEVSKYNLQVIVNEGQDTLSSSQVFTVLEAGNIPFDEWVPFEIAAGEEFVGDVLAPEAENLFVFMKKGDRIGYDGTWYGEARLRLGEETLAAWSKAEDFGFRIKDPHSTVYSIDIHNDRNYAVSGLVKVSYAPEWLKLNEWQKGEILRPYGYDWKYFDIGDNVDSLYFKTEGYGLWSTIEVFYQDMEEPEERWIFSNMGAGYAIQGNIPNPKPGRYYIRYKDSAVLQNTENDDQKREYLVYVGTKISPPTNVELSIYSLSSNKVGKGIATLKLEGVGFSEGDTIFLERDGHSSISIIPNNIDVESRSLEFSYDFSNVETGMWDIKVKNSNEYASLKNGLEVERTSDANLWVEISGRDKVRIGRRHKVILKYGNAGNVDAEDVLMYIKIPENVLDSIYLPTSNYPEFDIPTLKTEVNLIFLPQIPSHSANEFEIVLFTNEDMNLELEVGYLNLVTTDEEMLSQSYNARRAGTGEASKLTNEDLCSEDPDSGDVVFKYFAFDGKNLVANVHAGIVVRRIDPDGEERAYVVEVGYTPKTSLSAYLYARRWQVLESERLAFLRMREIIKKDSSKKEAFRQEFLRIGIDIDDPAYKEGLTSWKDRDGEASYIGHATVANNSFDRDTISNITYQNYINHNHVDGVYKYEIYSALPLYLPKYGKALVPIIHHVNKIHPEAIDFAGHCGSFVYEMLRLGLGEEAESYFTPNNYPFRQLIKLRSAGKLCLDNSSNNYTPIWLIPASKLDSSYTQIVNGLPKIRSNYKKLNLQSVSSVTPEDKYGPTGFDQGSDLALENRKRFVPEGQLFEYKIDYWNKEDATAPAAEVFIRDTLHTNFDINTFNFTEIGFLRWKLPLEGGKYFNVTVDMRPEKNLLVNVEGTLDMENRVVFWTHRSLDPETMELPEDPMAGYLPPIDSTGYNIGWVNFTIAPVDSLGHNVMFQNQSHVNFDGVGPWGPAPPYGPYTNTIDLSAPASYVKTLPATVDPEFEVQWGGSDDGAGIQYHDVYVSKNDGEFELWLTSTSDSLSTFQGETGNSYAFYSIAIDYAGNKEAGKTQAEATTKVLIRTFKIEDITTTSPICTGEENGSVTINTSSTNVELEYSLDNATFQDKNSFENLAPGDYTAYVRDKANPENIVQKAFTINPAANKAPATPTISIEGEDGKSQELLLVSSSATGNQWFKDGAIVEGATAQSIEASEAGTYHVVVTGVGGCSASSEMITITALPEVNNLDLKLYPNPADAFTTISLGREVNVDKITVYSAMGVVLKEMADSRKIAEIRLDLKGLVPGIYFVQVQGTGFVERLKLIIR